MKDVTHLLEDLERAQQKYSATYSIGVKIKSSNARKKKEEARKAKKRKLENMESRKERACLIYMSLGGMPIDGQYNPEVYGVPQIDDIDLETLATFTSKTDKACLADLLTCKCFVAEAADTVQEFLE